MRLMSVSRFLTIGRPGKAGGPSWGLPDLAPEHAGLTALDPQAAKCARFPADPEGDLALDAPQLQVLDDQARLLDPVDEEPGLRPRDHDLHRSTRRQEVDVGLVDAGLRRRARVSGWEIRLELFARTVLRPLV